MNLRGIASTQATEKATLKPDNPTLPHQEGGACLMTVTATQCLNAHEMEGPLLTAGPKDTASRSHLPTPL